MYVSVHSDIIVIEQHKLQQQKARMKPDNFLCDAYLNKYLYFSVNIQS